MQTFRPYLPAQAGIWQDPPLVACFIDVGQELVRRGLAMLVEPDWVLRSVPRTPSPPGETATAPSGAATALAATAPGPLVAATASAEAAPTEVASDDEWGDWHSRGRRRHGAGP
jgi:hypothetical protein